MPAQNTLNPTDPGLTYAKDQNTFYKKFITDTNELARNNGDSVAAITANEKSKIDALLAKSKNGVARAIQEDQRECIRFENLAAFKAAIDPISYPDILAQFPPLNNFTIPKYDPTKLDTPEQEEYSRRHKLLIASVQEKYKSQYNATLEKLKDEQKKEYDAFNAQLASYIQKVSAANPATQTQVLADNLRKAFDEYQQKQLTDLAQLYQARTDNFLQRVKDAEHDLRSLQNQGKERADLIRSSVTGDAKNPALEELPDQSLRYYSIPIPLNKYIIDETDTDLTVKARVKLALAAKAASDPNNNMLTDWWYGRKLKNAAVDFEKKIGWDPLKKDAFPSMKFQFSVDIKGEGSQAVATVRFDTPLKQVPYEMRLDAWFKTFDGLLDRKQDFFMLFSALETFTPDEQENAVKAMAAHILSKNPNATIEAGYFNNSTLKPIIDAARDGSLVKNTRASKGFPAKPNLPDNLTFNAEPIERPTTRLEGAAGLTADQARAASISMGAPGSPINSVAAAAARGRSSNPSNPGQNHSTESVSLSRTPGPGRTN